MEKLSHRRASTIIEIRDKAGNPIRNAKALVKQTGHDFLFGIGGFDALSMTCAKTEKEKAFFEDRLSKQLAIFNYFTMPIYWGIYEPREGITRKEDMEKAVRFLKEHHATIKGHPLCWHTVCAEWLLEYKDEEILQKQIARIHREMKDFEGLIDAWDVINETVILPDFDKYDNAISRLCHRYGRLPLIRTVFQEAENSKTGAKLVLNDFNVTNKYEEVIEECLDAGVKIDVIGIQSHQHQGYWGKDKLQDVIGRFSQFGIPLHFTENTILSGALIPGYIEDLNDWQVSDWPSTEEGEIRQAEEVEEMYRILFASPAVQAVTWWDFADGAWLGAPSGLVRKDGSLKPVYQKLDEMVNKEWTTSYEAVTDENGLLLVEGYTGDYNIFVQDQTFEVKL